MSLGVQWLVGILGAIAGALAYMLIERRGRVIEQLHELVHELELRVGALEEWRKRSERNGK